MFLPTVQPVRQSALLLGHPLSLRLAWLVLVVVVMLAPPPAHARGLTVEAIRSWSGPDHTRVVLDISGVPAFRKSETEDPPCLILELTGTRFGPKVDTDGIADARILAVRLLPADKLPAQVVFDLAGRRAVKVFTLPPGGGKPHRLVIDVLGPLPRPVAGTSVAKDGTKPSPERQDEKPAAAAPAPRVTEKPVEQPPPVSTPDVKPAPPATAAAPEAKPAVPDRPWVIVLDPGHGGHDPGAKGPGGLREKDVCLALAKVLAADLNRRPGYTVHLTRDKDVFLHLRERTRIAAEKKADLFVSIHCNSSPSKKARGTEVFFLSLRGASDESAREVAMRENAADHVEGVPVESQEEIEDILVDLLQTSALERSSELAATIVERLREDKNLELRGVKQAGFDVLKTAGMPSILVEAAFISHQKESKLLKSSDFQRRFARLVSSGIAEFLDRAAATEAPASAARGAGGLPAAVTPTAARAPAGS